MVPRRLSRVVKELRGLLATAPAPVATLLSEGARQLTQQLAHHYGAHALACSHAVGLGKAAVLRCGVTVAAEEGLASVGGLVLQRSSWAAHSIPQRTPKYVLRGRSVWPAWAHVNKSDAQTVAKGVRSAKTVDTNVDRQVSRIRRNL